jgi:hypothetical protein
MIGFCDPQDYYVTAWGNWLPIAALVVLGSDQKQWVWTLGYAGRL